MTLSGKTIVAAAGESVPLGSQAVNASVMVKALAGNTNLVYLGSDGAGDVSSANGIELAAGEVVVFDWVANLADIRLDAAVSGEGVAWLILEA